MNEHEKAVLAIYRNYAQQAQRDRERLRRALQAVEWVRMNSQGFHMCPDCGALQEKGGRHNDDCEIVTALALPELRIPDQA